MGNLHETVTNEVRTFNPLSLTNVSALHRGSFTLLDILPLIALHWKALPWVCLVAQRTTTTSFLYYPSSFLLQLLCLSCLCQTHDDQQPHRRKFHYDVVPLQPHGAARLPLPVCLALLEVPSQIPNSYQICSLNCPVLSGVSCAVADLIHLLPCAATPLNV